MDKLKAIEKMEFLVAKGWTFEMAVDNTGWRCEAVGAGLAHGRGSDLFFEKAVALAIKDASAMEDNPSVVIAKYKDAISSALRKAFGPIDFEISPTEQDWDWGPMRIEVRMKAIGDPKTMVDREMEFMRLFARQPMEIRDALRIRFEWPEEQAASK
jgi:hypothetical protein